MFLIHTNKSRNSKTTIEAVMQLKTTQSEKFYSIIEQLGKITENLIEDYT